MIHINSNPTVYLAGSVQFVKDGKTWREEIMDEYSMIDWISPYDGPHMWTHDKPEAFMWCKQQVLRSDIVFIRYEHGEETWGTPSEMIWAWEAGIPVFAWHVNPPSDLPNFLVVVAEMIDARRDLIIENIVENYLTGE